MSFESVKIWEEKVVFPTYDTGDPEKNPMFFEKRVYQGSSGSVYPNAVIEKISDQKSDKQYTGLFLENKYLKILILPELGGRIQMAYDKIKERHFIYYNRVIKPALVGLTGPWISGGIEFNWPQHHRPSTYEPIDYTLSENEDGSKTVWVNELEKMSGTKGMAGFTLHPDRAYLEIKAKLYNRTSLPQTFLWWANPAVKVNDDYQSVFPPDVNAVFDHGKRDVSSFPIATGTYYKVDYAPGTDISRYKNIPVPTSYMAINSEYDFMGGYEHDTRAGVLHVANHHVSPGKKQWTWGYSDFGQAWDRNLTDEDGPYIELMTGMFTDNQPDFTWLMPYEEKTFTQYFLPYQELGLVKNASKDILLNVEKAGNEAIVKIFATSEYFDLHLVFEVAGNQLYEDVFLISPANVIERRIQVPEDSNEKLFAIKISDNKGRELLRYDPSSDRESTEPKVAKAALKPQDIENNEQLFLTGHHLEQYRHATYSPPDYYLEALRRDPEDIRCNNALGLWYLRRGKFTLAVKYLEQAVGTSISRNPNPYDSEPYYNLGLVNKYMGNYKAAYDALYKSTWSSAWQDAGYFSLAQVDVMRGDFNLALDHIEKAIDRNANNGKAYCLRAAILRKLKSHEKAVEVTTLALQRDLFNLGALYEQYESLKSLDKANEAKVVKQRLLILSRQTSHNLIEYAVDYASAGLYTDACELLQLTDSEKRSPLVYYYLAFFYYQAKDERYKDQLLKAADASPYLCFPNRLEDIAVLEFAINENASDYKAPYYLGNLWYDKRQYQEAIDYWEQSVKRNSCLPTVHRNLGIAYFNKRNDVECAVASLEKANELDRTDARIAMELDQLYKRINKPPIERLDVLEKNLETVMERDDLYLERLSLYNFLGESQKAYDLILERQFHPWEGGEGKVSGQYVYALIQLARQSIQDGAFQKAIAFLEQAQTYPHNLGEGKLFGVQENDIFFWMGCAHKALGQSERAAEYYRKATIGQSKPEAAMFYNDQQPDKIFYQGLAWIELGESTRAEEIFESLYQYGNMHKDDEVEVDYFAVSLPNLLIFEDNLNLRNRSHCLYMLGLGLAGFGEVQAAEKVFREVLELDAMHFGATSHLSLVSSYRFSL